MTLRISLALILILATSGMASPADDEADIVAMMSEYRDAFVAMDARRVAAVFSEPYTFLAPSPGPVSALTNRAEVEASVRQQMARLKERGYARGDLKTIRVKSFGNGTAIASTVWQRYKADGSVLETIGATFLLRKEPSGWKIAVLTPHAPESVLTLP
jgi:ketosteroid isomerase-like protein